MSLLNDMLRDLSHSQKNAEAMSVSALELQQDEQRELLNQSSVIKSEPGKLWPSMVVFIGVFIILWIWKQGEWFSAPEQIATNPPITTSDVKQTSPAIVQPSVVRTQVEQATPSTDSTAVLNERLAALETAITKLSSAVEESQPTASENAIAEHIGTENVAAEKASVETSEVVTEQQASVSIRDPFSPEQDFDQQQRQKNSPPESTSVAMAAEKTTRANTHLSVTPNPGFLDQREAEQGRQLAAQGQASDAIIALQAFIAKAQTPLESTRALLDIFAEQENVAAIESVLAQADYLSQLDQQFYAARVAIIQQREDRAIELLEVQIAEADGHESYRSLLAGLYQRAGKYSEAASAYRRLLGNFGEKPAYWLGFALAQDSLSQRQIARQAYLRVAEYADLQPEVRAYIQQRLAALQ